MLVGTSTNLCNLVVNLPYIVYKYGKTRFIVIYFDPSSIFNGPIIDILVYI